MAMFQVAADHQATIVMAVKQSRFASALALLRSRCEATIMGMWILHCASDENLEALGKDLYAPPSLDKLVKQVDSNSFLDRPMYRDISEAIERMHGFTHGGLLHIASRYMGDRVGANYAETDVVWALRTADLFAVLSALEAAEVTENAARAATMYREAKVLFELGDSPSASD